MYLTPQYIDLPRRIRAVTCFLILILAGPGTAIGQAWTMPKGGSYVKVFYGKVTAGEQYTFDGRRADYIDGLKGDTYRDRSLYIYSELGLSDRFSLVLSFPYKRTFVRDHAFRFRLFGPGTATIGGRLSLLSLLGIQPGRHALSVNLLTYVPTGYVRNYTPSSGAGQIDILGTLFYGHSFHPVPAYAQIGAGYKYRSSVYGFSSAVPCNQGSDIHCITDNQANFGDEFLFHVEAGFSPFDGFLFVQVLGLSTWSLEEPSIGFSPLNPIPAQQRFVKAGVGVGIYPFSVLPFPPLSSLGINIQYFETPYGRNTIKSRDLFIGVEFRPDFSRNKTHDRSQ